MSKISDSIIPGLKEAIEPVDSKSTQTRIRVFGPVPSRRLGKSIGINNIPPKICSYSCIYCQLGISLKVISDRREFYEPNDLLIEIKEKIANANANNEAIDYLTIVPDGEPTLDINLGRLINLIKPLGFKIAVITNSTLLGDPQVRKELCNADWVSVKVDTVDEQIWRKADRPHRKIEFESMLEGIKAFSQEFNGKLVTETMLIEGMNDEVTQVAKFISELNPAIAYLSIPTRPPALKSVKAPKEEIINRAFQVFNRFSINTEYLIGYEGNEFAYTGNVEEDLLSITSVHPMREDAIHHYLKKANSDFSVVEEMLRENKMIVTEYNNERFYLRRLKS